MFGSILKGNILGLSVLSGFTAFPQPSAYTNIEIYGNSIVDNVQVKNVLISETEIINLPSIPTEPVFDGYTLMLATFNNGNLNAGNANVSYPITGWDLFRRKSDEQVFTKLITTGANVGTYIDNRVEPNATYIYELFGFNATERTAPIVATIESSYYNWVLSSIDGTINYIFDLNLNSDGFDNAVASNIYDGYGKYSKVTQGIRDYRTGKIEAIVASQVTDTGIVQTVEFIDGLRSFINNGEEKILKSRKGDVLRVATNKGMESKVLSDAIGQQPYVVGFEFIEVGDLY